MRNQTRLLARIPKSTRIPRSTKRFLQFAVVGAIGFLVDALGFSLFSYLTQSPIYLARAFAFLPAVTTTWYFNRKLTFGDRPKLRKKHREYGAYLAVYLLGMSVNFSVFMVAISAIPHAKDYWLIPLAIGTLAGLVFNYGFLNLQVFRASPFWRFKQLASLKDRF